MHTGLVIMNTYLVLDETIIGLYCFFFVYMFILFCLCVYVYVRVYLFIAASTKHGV